MPFCLFLRLMELQRWHKWWKDICLFIHYIRMQEKDTLKMKAVNNKVYTNKVYLLLFKQITHKNYIKVIIIKVILGFELYPTY